MLIFLSVKGVRGLNYIKLYAKEKIMKVELRPLKRDNSFNYSENIKRSLLF